MRLNTAQERAKHSIVSPEESFEVLGQFCPASISWVHGDKETHSGHQTNFYPLKEKPFLLVSNGILYALHLTDEEVQHTMIKSEVREWSIHVCT